MTTTVFTLTGITPPARFDDLAWVSGRIEESSTETGSYTLLELIDLDPVDDDPSQPASRSFTSELATVSKWYRVVFVDEDGDLSEPSAPIQNVAEIVVAYGTTAELAANLNIRTPTTAQTTSLERVLLAAAGEIRSEIGRSDLAGWELSLATEVGLERAAEHWQQLKSPFGVLGLGSEFGATHTSRDSWDRHAKKLAPLKRSWGLA